MRSQKPPQRHGWFSPFLPAVDLQRKWKSFRNSFRRELTKVWKAKATSTAETGRKKYMYFRQLFFLLPICEATQLQQQQEEVDREGPAEGRNPGDESQVSPRANRKRKAPLSPFLHEISGEPPPLLPPPAHPKRREAPRGSFSTRWQGARRGKREKGTSTIQTGISCSVSCFTSNASRTTWS